MNLVVRGRVGVSARSPRVTLSPAPLASRSRGDRQAASSPLHEHLPARPGRGGDAAAPAPAPTPAWLPAANETESAERAGPGPPASARCWPGCAGRAGFTQPPALRWKRRSRGFLLLTPVTGRGTSSAMAAGGCPTSPPTGSTRARRHRRHPVAATAAPPSGPGRAPLRRLRARVP